MENIVKKVCKELDVTQKELAEQIGVAEGTLRNWSSSNDIPTWALKSFELLQENYKNKEIVETIKKAQEILSSL